MPDQSSEYDITYKYLRTDFVPISTIVLTVASLFWSLAENSRNGDVDTAIAFFIGFGFLALFEFYYRWWKVTKYNGFTFVFNNHGVTIRKGSWTKEYPWSNYKSFGTVYAARFGKWAQYIPLFNILIHSTDRELINLYRKEQFRTDREWDPFLGSAPDTFYDRIPTLPSNHEQIVKYIEQYLPENTKLRLNERI